jgi:hypothetical protein
MISESRVRSLKEKHEAYKTIIREYPDTGIPKGHRLEYIPSFHKALGEIMLYEEQILEAYLKKEPNTVYELKMRYWESEDNYDWELYATHEQALAEMYKLLGNEKEMCVKRNCKKSEFSHGMIRKKFLQDDDFGYIEVRVSKHGEIIDLNYSTKMYNTPELSFLLSEFYIDIPVPFKKGDLIEYDDGNDWMGKVYVLRNLCRDDEERNAKWIIKADISDMTADVYYESDGNVECECIHFYPDLRYCRRELHGEKRILKYTSLYLQDKLCLCNLLKIQKYLMLDAKATSIVDSSNLEYDLEQLGEKLTNTDKNYRK